MWGLTGSASYSDFEGLGIIPQLVYQPHAFEAVTQGYFCQRAKREWKACGCGRLSTVYGISRANCAATWHDQPWSGDLIPTGEECIFYFLTSEFSCEISNKRLEAACLFFYLLLSKEVINETGSSSSISFE